MQIRNNYDKEVFNGDIGTIQGINMDDRALTILFDDRSVEYDVTELDEIVLAYATTVHKAQGAEYPIVVMPVMMTHFTMLQRNLLYTGVTNSLERRTLEHIYKLDKSGFAEQYNCNKLVYYESTSDVKIAIEREKQIKGMTRFRKNKLITQFNAEWKDLFNV